MSFIDNRVTALVRDSETLHQSFEDSSLIFEAAKSQRQVRNRRLHRRVYPSPERRGQISDGDRLATLVNYSERILRFLTRQYPSLEAAEGTHCHTGTKYIISYKIGFDFIDRQSLSTTKF
jgi:hypothetical protein